MSYSSSNHLWKIFTSSNLHMLEQKANLTNFFTGELYPIHNNLFNCHIEDLPQCMVDDTLVITTYRYRQFIQ